MIIVIPSTLIVDLSRAQFAFTALFHFLFVPLTLGLTWLLVVMEAAYLITGNETYKDMVRFWGKLLAINFAIGVLSGITLEFEFGLNWAYFSRLIGGSFGPILAIEGITAFMLEATMFGLFFFSWDKLSRKLHFVVTMLMAAGATLSIVNILAANSWMQHPIASVFDYHSMSINLKSLADLYINMLAQVRIGHVAFAGYLTGSMFVMGISAFYILKGRDVAFAKRSFAAAAGFAMVSVLVVGFYGDQNGLQVAKYEPEKMAAIEAQWTTQQAPAAWYMIAFPNQAQEKNYFTLKIPYMLSLIATHSLTGTVEGEKELQKTFAKRVRNGLLGYEALIRLRKGDKSAATIAEFNKHRQYIGFALLLKHFRKDINNATATDIKKAAKFAIPDVFIAFWSFRIMLAMWGLMLLLTFFGFVYCLRRTLDKHRLFLRLMVFGIPLPFIAVEFGWILAENGRQPWSVHNLLPTFYGVSSISLSTIVTSLVLFVIFYAFLISIEMFLMFKYARLGPSAIHTGKYHFEKLGHAEDKA